jgi:hypothetical protein
MERDDTGNALEKSSQTIWWLGRRKLSVINNVVSF